ncbi:sushi, von Willebrand factor type A, EGF and pentraxin domain-containing protein 1-like [Diadema setosum]|uniref:sushi, von Willebrand factor type A, EGF and pentraxin domain-containing protein 1-like n=1 Tax=Diadema setosum TaxID=31175 RepID=UPI003B3B4784
MPPGVEIATNDKATYDIDDEFTVRCTSNRFKLAGPGHLKCIEVDFQGAWNREVPKCVEKLCQDITLEHGSVVLSGNSIGGEASFSCNEGFDLQGASTATCVEGAGSEDDPSWDSVPVCKDITCPRFDKREDEYYSIIDGTDQIRVYVNEWNAQDANGPVTVSCNLKLGRAYDFTADCVFTCTASDAFGNTCEAEFTIFVNKKSCGEPPELDNGSRTGNGRLIGETVTYSCNPGFEDEGGEKTITCKLPAKTNDPIADFNAQPSWTAGPGSCRRKSCGKLNDPANGNVQDNPRTFESEATYSCNDGFELSGEPTRTCESNNNGGVQWSGDAPTCNRKSCGKLNDPANGNVQDNPRTFESKATYSCNDGYELSGEPTRTCESDNNGGVQWSGDAPTCNRMSCGKLNDPENGNVQDNPRTFESEATYSCNDGYELSGEPTRTCESNNNGGVQWSGDAPTCNRKSCGKLNDPANGNVQDDPRTFESEATYSCNDGFELSGEPTRTCESNNNGGVEWSGDAPTCNRKSCGKLNDPENGNVQDNPRTFESEATYSCNDGYELSGEPTRTCESDNNGGVQWSGDAPTCNRMSCGKLNDPENGNVQDNPRTFESEATYSCNDGYELSGEPTRTCESDNNGGVQWSGDAPTCNRMSCGKLNDPENGNVQDNPRTFESEATYSCNDGYELSGEPTRTCESDNNGGVQWSGDAPTCNRMSCGKLNDPENGNVQDNPRTFESEATYSCNDGYELSGEPTRTCESDNNGGVQWSGDAPTCNRMSCGKLNDPENGNVQDNPRTFESEATYSCNDGYKLSGEPTRTCESDNNGGVQWSGDAPTCNSMSCGKLNDPENGNVQDNPRTFESEATYSCNDGFELSGEPTRTCESDNNGGVQWSGDAPTCNRMSCGKLNDPENGNVQDNPRTFESEATYSCNDGFELSGEPTRTCESDNNGGVQWSGDAPTCNRMSCGKLNDPENGNVQDNPRTFESEATYSCNDGFELSGEPTRTCESNNNGGVQWSGDAPTCNPKSCGEPDDLENGNVGSNSNTFGDTATYSCNDGYDLEGEPTRTCESNNNDGVQWSGDAPTCKAKSCGEPDDLENGNVESDSNTLGDTATYSCNDGYDLEGEPTRTCESNNNGGVEWSGDAPTCKPKSCGEPDDLENGNVESDSNTLGDTATYSCNDGYDLEGEPTRTCESNNNGGVEWSGDAPTCKRKLNRLDSK